MVRSLVRAGIAAEAIHGNKSQGQRERVLAAFRKGEVRTLVATDIAARGIDVDGISHVVNYDLPNVPETYVHRIGRTARAGAAGIAISLCDGEEMAFLRDIEKLIRMSIPLSDRRADPRHSEPVPAKHAAARPPSHGKDRHWHRGNGNSHKGNGNSHKQGRRHQPSEAAAAGAGGIEAVAFLAQRPAAARPRAACSALDRPIERIITCRKKNFWNSRAWSPRSCPTRVSAFSSTTAISSSPTRRGG